MTQVVNGYVRWPFGRTRQATIICRDGTLGLRALGLFVGAARQLIGLAGQRNQVIVVHLSQGGSFVREGFLLCLARWLRVPTVAHLHGSRFVAFAERRPWLVGTVLRHADRLVVLSEATRAVAARWVPPAKIALVPNAVPTGNPGKKERLVVFGGAVTRRKGVDVLVEAWRRADPGPAWRLVVAGPHVEADLVVSGAGSVEFPGALCHDDLMRLLDRASVAVLPSRDEAMPMFILEAMARHAAIVSTRVGGIPAVLSDEAGWLVDPGAVEGLTDALAHLTTDASIRQGYADRARARFLADFAAEAIYPRVEQIWLDALASRGQPEAKG
jgi:glycosyltransferase involved in cell wall biosynthesis